MGIVLVKLCDKTSQSLHFVSTDGRTEGVILMGLCMDGALPKKRQNVLSKLAFNCDILTKASAITIRLVQFNPVRF
jgi:hypothetical protein